MFLTGLLFLKNVCPASVCRVGVGHSGWLIITRERLAFPAWSDILTSLAGWCREIRLDVAEYLFIPFNPGEGGVV